MRDRTLDGPALLAWMRENSTVTASGCWEWAGSRFKLGYGVVSYRGKNRSAHRVAALLGGILSDLDADDCVLHKCDNRPCCNPEHLEVGTQLENVAQRVNRGRGVHPVGAKASRSKLTVRQVVDIRADPRTNAAVAAELGLNPETVARVRRRETYGDVE